jgi:hypothetical protein
MRSFRSFFLGFISVIDWLPYLPQNTFQVGKKTLILTILILGIQEIKFTKNKNLFIFLLTTQLLYSIILIPVAENYYSLSGLISLFLVVVFVLVVDGFSLSKFITGYYLGLFASLIVMLLTLFGIEIDRSGLRIDGMGDFFLSDRFSLASMGLTNKYNKMSYLFGLGVLLVNCVHNDRKLSLKIGLTLAFVVGCIVAGGRGGLLILLIALLAPWFKINKLSNLLVLLTVGGIIVMYIDSLELLFTSRNARLGQLTDAYELIGNRPIIGYGYGSTQGREYEYFHNFFIGGWYQGGLIGLFLRIMLFVFMLNMTMKSTYLRIKTPLLAFIILQCMVEDFNPLRIGTSYLIFWLIIYNVYDKNRYSRGLLVN